MVNLDPDGFLETRRHEDLRGAPWSCIHPRAEGRPGTNARTDPVDSGDEDVVPAVLGGVVRAAVPVNAPVAGEEGGDAGRARAIGHHYTKRPFLVLGVTFFLYRDFDHFFLFQSFVSILSTDLKAFKTDRSYFWTWFGLFCDFFHFLWLENQPWHKKYQF